MSSQVTSALPIARSASEGRRKKRNNRLQEVAMLLPACLLIALFLLVPFISSFQIALTNQRLIPRPVPTRFVGLGNFAQVLSDPEFWTALLNVVRFTLMILPIQCGMALALALLLNQKLPFRNFFRGVFFLPAITSMAVVCVIWATLFQYPSGPLNQILSFVSADRSERTKLSSCRLRDVISRARR